MSTASTSNNPSADAQARLVNALVAEGRMSTAQRTAAMAQQATAGAFLGEILVDMGIIAHEEWPALLAKHCRIPFVSLLDYLIDVNLLIFVPEEVCKRHKVLPVDKMGRHLTLAMVHPMDQVALNEVQALNPTFVIRPILCDPGHYVEVSRRVFTSDPADVSEQLMNQLVGTKTAKKPAVEPEAPKDIAPAASTVDETTADLDGAPSDPLGSSSLNLADAMGEMMSMAQQSMDGTYEVLARRIALFHGLEPRAVARIFALGITKEVSEGTVIFEKGAPGDSLYVIVSGCVRIIDNGKEIAILSTGDTFGEMSVVTGEPRSATAIAAQTTSLLILSETQFQKLMTKQVSIRLLLNMLGTMSARLRKSNDILRSLIR